MLAIFVLEIAVLHDAVAHRPVGGFDIITAKSLRVGVGNHRNGVVGDHAPGLVAGQRPDGQGVLVELAIVGQHRADEVVDALRLDDRQQRMLGAEGIPQREGAIVLKTFRLVGLVVEPEVAAVGVVEQRRRDARVVQIRVESLSRGGIARLDLDFAENVAPSLRRGGHGSVEIPGGNLGGQVLPRPFDAYRGKADLHEHRLAGIVEIETRRARECPCLR